jgi:light-harvesting complex I chlorophyll a/b binding protein 1
MFRLFALASLFFTCGAFFRGTPPKLPVIEKFVPIIRGPTAPLETSEIFKPEVVAKDVDIVFLREAELKHGRVAMLAALILPALEAVSDGLAIHKFDQLTDISQFSLIYFVFVMEFYSMFNSWQSPLVKVFGLNPDHQPGDYKLGLWNATDPSTGDLMDKELNNGRLAMIGVLGMVVQELVTQQRLF